MAGPYNVLVFPGGTEIGLEIRGALANRKEVRLFSAGAAGSSHAPFAYRVHDVLPSIDEPGWFDALVDCMRRREIDFIFGAHEDVLLELARRRDGLPAPLVAPSLEVIETVRSKSRTYEALAGVVRTPRTIDPHAEEIAFPVFVKPDRGAGSRAARLVSSRAELELAVAGDEPMLVSEYLPGIELTVDCFSDRDRGLLYCGPRRRDRVRAGISMDSTPVDEPEVEEMARRIARALGIHGAWFFQVRQADDGAWALLEVGARIGGTMALSRARGVNLPWLAILEEERSPMSVLVGDYDVQIDRALLNRYRLGIEYDTVYVDLDDTMIVDGRVNVPVVAFLYQALNQGKRIVVLTRHAGDPAATLATHRLAGIADEIVHLAAGESKAAAITERRAVFIDDSYGERLDVNRATGIPVFDGNMVEALMDDRA